MKYILEGLHCATCSKKIQHDINKLEQVDHAEFNPITKEMMIDLNEKVNEKRFFSEVEKIVHFYEPDVRVIDPNLSKDNEDEIASQSTVTALLKKNLPELIGIVLFAATILFRSTLTVNNMILLSGFILAYLLIGGDVILSSAKNISRGKVFDENFLMTVATVGAIFLGDYVEGVAVMLFYKIGESLSDYAQDRSIRSVNELIELQAPYANLIGHTGTKQIKAEDVKVGDLILVKAGEQVPVDGMIVSGTAYADTKSVTGESVPRRFEKDDLLYSGYIITESPVTVKATKRFEDSMIQTIIQLTKEASRNKAKADKFITKFAGYYTPVVVFLALAIAVFPALLGYGTYAEWIKRGLIFLVISCPCALVLSVPLSYFAGLGAASKMGILIKGANHLETMAKIKTAVFDKTGTLTKGEFRVSNIIHEDGITQEQIIEYLAAAEQFSNHPIAKAIISHLARSINENDVEKYVEHAGKGVSLEYQGRILKAGTAPFVGVTSTQQKLGATYVYVSVDGEYVGHCELTDEIKTTAKDAIAELRRLGVEKTVMLTGDNRDAASGIADELKIDEVRSDLLPGDKINAYHEISYEGGKIFVGDGINDAPLLAGADVGVAMGALGSDAAIEAADVVIMTDQLREVALGIRLAKFTRNIVIQNIVFVLLVKIFVMSLGAFGVATMGEAVFADVGTALIATLNSMRILRKKYEMKNEKR